MQLSVSFMHIAFFETQKVDGIHFTPSKGTYGKQASKILNLFLFNCNCQSQLRGIAQASH